MSDAPLHAQFQTLSAVASVVRGEPMAVIAILVPANGGTPELLSNMDYEDQLDIIQHVVRNWDNTVPIAEGSALN